MPVDNRQTPAIRVVHRHPSEAADRPTVLAMSFDLDLPRVRTCAAALTDLGGVVAAGVTRLPDAPSVPLWSTSDALGTLLITAAREVSVAGEDVATAGRRIASIADDYEAADGRAASRLRDLRWK